MAIRDILDRQAGIIEYVLHTHGIAAQVDGGKLSPRLAHFHLMLPPGLSPARLSPFVNDIAASLGVISCRLAHLEGGVYLEVPRPDPVPVRLLPLVQRVADVVPPVTASLGLDTDGTPLLLRLNSPEVDPVIVTGNGASGKSSLLRGMALSLALHNSPERVRMLLLDCTGDGVAFRGLDRLPHLACPLANGAVDSLVSLRWALRVLARRTPAPFYEDELTFDDMGEEDMGPEDEPLFEYSPLQAEEPALVLMIDGADRLISTPNGRINAETTDALRRLLLTGSANGIHVVLSSERPDELAELSTGWGARIVGRVGSAEAARLATGARGSGAQGLLGAGDFLVTLNAELIRFQAAAVSRSEIQKAVDLICNCANSYPQPNTDTRQGVGDAATPRGREQGRATQVEEPRSISRGWYGE